MRAGLLSEVISVYKPFIGDSEFGKSTKTDYVLHIPSTRARVMNNKGTRTNENNEIVYAYTVTFVVRGYHKIEDVMRIKWKDRFYRILNIIPPTREINDYQIDTELVNE